MAWIRREFTLGIKGKLRSQWENTGPSGRRKAEQVPGCQSTLLFLDLSNAPQWL